MVGNQIIKYSPSYSVTWSDLGTATTASTGNWKLSSSTGCSDWMTSNGWIDFADGLPDRLPAKRRTLELPDGAKLIIDDSGNYRIEDADAKVTYKAHRIREFSPHLNASDMVAKFVEYVGQLGVKQNELLGLPIELFINWLVVEAAERDNDPIPDDVIPVERHSLIQSAVRPRCLSCGRFIPRLHQQKRFPFCGVEHGYSYVSRYQQNRITSVVP